MSPAALLFFPIAWSTGNYLYFGDFFYSFVQISHPPALAHPVGIATATTRLSHQALGDLGWLLSFAAIIGLVGEVYRTVRGRVSAQRTAYAILVAAVWAMNFRGTLTLGPAVEDRYLLLAAATAHNEIRRLHA